MTVDTGQAEGSCRSDGCGGAPGWQDLPDNLRGYCSDCRFWLAKEGQPGQVFVEQGGGARHSYYFNTAEPVVRTDYPETLLGFRGTPWRVTFTDGRVVVTNNLYGEGEIPSRFHGMFPPNASLERLGRYGGDRADGGPPLHLALAGQASRATAELEPPLTDYEAGEAVSPRPPLPDGMAAEPGQEPGGRYFEPYFGREYTVDAVSTDVRPQVDPDTGRVRWIPGKTWLEVSWIEPRPGMAPASGPADPRWPATVAAGLDAAASRHASGGSSWPACQAVSGGPAGQAGAHCCSRPGPAGRRRALGGGRCWSRTALTARIRVRASAGGSGRSASAAVLARRRTNPAMTRVCCLRDAGA